MARIPGIGWYALGGALGLGGLAVAALIVWQFVSGLEDLQRFVVPGTASVEIARPGRHVLWHEHQTVFEGRSFDLPAAMPDGARFEVKAPDGRLLGVQPYANVSSSDETSKRVAAARFDAERAGTHRVSVTGDFSPRVMAVGADFVWPMLAMFAGVMAAAVVGIGSGIAAALYGFFSQVQGTAGAGRRDLEPERERALRQLAALVYGLQAAALLVGVTLIAGAVLSYLKRREAEGSWLESHFRWQIRTFWWSLAWSVLGLATAVLLVGFLILGASAVWFVYRVARGWTELNDGRPMYREPTSPRP